MKTDLNRSTVLIRAGSGSRILSFYAGACALALMASSVEMRAQESAPMTSADADLISAAGNADSNAGGYLNLSSNYMGLPLSGVYPEAASDTGINPAAWGSASDQAGQAEVWPSGATDADSTVLNNPATIITAGSPATLEDGSLQLAVEAVQPAPATDAASVGAETLTSADTSGKIARDKEVETRSFTPVTPEPSTWAMMLGGVGLLLGAQRFLRARKA